MSRWPFTLLVRLADSGPVSAGFWRLALAFPLIYIFALRTNQPTTGLPRKFYWLLALSGIAFAMDLASWHLGIERTKLANATLLGNSGSLIMMVYGFIIAHALPRRNEWAAMLLSLLGAALLMGRSYSLSFENFIGDALCLLAGALYAVYLIALGQCRRDMGGWAVLVWSIAFGLAPIALVAHLLGEPFWPQNWTPVVILALSSQVIGQGLMVYALKFFTPVVIGIALLSQPAIAALTGWFAFGETLGIWEVFGMLAIGVALILVRLPDKRKIKNLPATGGTGNPVIPE